MDHFIISQALLCVTIIFDIASFQFKRRRIILLCFFVAAAFNSAHFFFLQQWTGAGLMAIGSLRYLISIFITSQKAAIPFMIFAVVTAFFTYSGIISILACSGSLLKTVAAFCRNDKHLRQIMMLGTVFWIVHNGLAESPLGVVMEVLFLASNLVGYYRFYYR